MSTLTRELARAKERGDQAVNDGFSGVVRSIENVALELNDEFTFPNEYAVYSQHIGENDVQYIFVELTNGNVKQFFPSTFTKARSVVNEDCSPTGVRKYTLGTAAELYRTKDNVKDAMDLLKGKTVKVTNIETIRTQRYGKAETMWSQIPTIDLVDAPKSKSSK